MAHPDADQKNAGAPVFDGPKSVAAGKGWEPRLSLRSRSNPIPGRSAVAGPPASLPPLSLGGPGRSSSLSFPLAACNSEAEPQRLGAGSRDLS